MGVFGFFKKKASVVEEIKIGSFEDAVRIFDDRVGVLHKREGDVLIDVIERLDGFYVSVEGKLEDLEGVDIEGKKEYERAKILVRQGLDKYVGFVRGLLGELKKKSSLVAEKFNSENWKGSDSENPEKFSFAGGLVGFANEIGKVFVGFEKESSKVYERATYLVGNEMMAVRNEIRKFYNGLFKMFGGSLIGDLGKVDNIRGKFDEVSGMEGKLGELESGVVVNDSEVARLKDRVIGLRREVSEIKNGEGYISYLKLKDEVWVLSKRIEREVLKLKGMIDFKKLVGIVHGNVRELEVVKRFRDSFVSEFSVDGGKLIGILESVGMKGVEMEGQVGLIAKLDEDLNEIRKVVGLDVSVSKGGEIGKIEREIEVKMIEGVKIRSRLREVGLEIERLKGEVVGLVGGLGESL